MRSVLLTFLMLLFAAGSLHAQPDLIFADGFESGHPFGWSTVVGYAALVLPYGGPEQSIKVWFSPIIEQADFVFDMDTTGSMGGELANLQAGFSAIVVPEIQTLVRIPVTV